MLKCCSAWKISHAARNNCSISSCTNSHPAILHLCFIHLQMVTLIYLTCAANERRLIVSNRCLGHRGHHSFPTPSETQLSRGCTGITAHSKLSAVAQGIHVLGEMRIFGSFLGKKSDFRMIAVCCLFFGGCLTQDLTYLLSNVWKGVLLHDFLLECGVLVQNMAGKHVKFVGVEALPNKVRPGPFRMNRGGNWSWYQYSIGVSHESSTWHRNAFAYLSSLYPRLESLCMHMHQGIEKQRKIALSSFHQVNIRQHITGTSISTSSHLIS